MQNAMLPVQQKIILLVGLPGAGKSTFLENLGVSALSSDEIRLLLADDVTDQTLHTRVFATVRYLLRQRLALGRPSTYIDATNLTVEYRKPFLDIARSYGCITEAIYFDVPLEVCRQRNRLRTRQVPDEALELMAARLVPPTLEEGFDRIERLSCGSL